MPDALMTLVQLVPSLAKLGSEIVSASGTTKANAQLIEFQQALIGLNSLVASVQQENATLLRQKNDAEEDLKRMKDWQGEKQRYELVSPHYGTLVYAVKKAMSNGQTPHYLCTNCFDSGKPSILQLIRGGEGVPMSSYVCSNPACKAKVDAGFRGGYAPKYAEDIPPAQ